MNLRERGSFYSLSVKEYTALKPLECRDDVLPWNSKESRGPLLMIGRDGFSPQKASIFSFFLSISTYATNESTPSHLKLYTEKKRNVSEVSTMFLSHFASLHARVAQEKNSFKRKVTRVRSISETFHFLVGLIEKYNCGNFVFPLGILITKIFPIFHIFLLNYCSLFILFLTSLVRKFTEFIIKFQWNSSRTYATSEIQLEL